MSKPVISFQGTKGAYSETAAKEFISECETVGHHTFIGAMEALKTSEADYACIPIENSSNGRVADVNQLIPIIEDAHIVGEFYLPIRHCLIGLPESDLSDITDVFSHEQAIGQCREYWHPRGITPHSVGDTAGAADYIMQQENAHFAAIASSDVANMRGLKILDRNIQTDKDNTTRFWLFSRGKDTPIPHFDKTKSYKTTVVFRTKNIPAALYKALGAFATNEVNMTSLESIATEMSKGGAVFRGDIHGHPSDPACTRALEELRFHCKKNNGVKILGVYLDKSPSLEAKPSPKRALAKTQQSL